MLLLELNTVRLTSGKASVPLTKLNQEPSLCSVRRDPNEIKRKAQEMSQGIGMSTVSVETIEESKN